MVQKSPQTPFLGDFNSFWHSVGGVLGPIIRIKAAKMGQNRVFKVPFAACKCWQRAFLVTKMHFALGNTKIEFTLPVAPTFVFAVMGWAEAFQRSAYFGGCLSVCIAV